MEPETAIVGNLDMTRHEDRGLLRRTVTDAEQGRRRWGRTPDEKMEDYVKALRVALRMAIEKNDHRAVTSIIQTRAVLERQDQTDEHKALDVAMYLDKNERLDSGKLTENAGLTFNIIPVEPPDKQENT